ncbi:MAG: non-canonical purine NTP diphosphatase [Muribaculaceae bacterium]|nr:non-canonical purine NTP diphosphatase [Muribaculaceae bacterium]
MRSIVFATNNAHKLAEARAILEGKVEVKSLNDIDCHDDIPETAPTLEGNALMKARWVSERYGVDCFADDTGLEVDALGGEPGVRSARYAPGAGHDSAANMKLLLENLTGKDDRTARFRTVVALITDGKEQTVEGKCEGRITESPSGASGFGYDPVFQPVGESRTFAEMSDAEKNAISHRGEAMRRLAELLIF